MCDNRKWKAIQQLLQWSRWTPPSGLQVIRTEWALKRRGSMMMTSSKALMELPMHWTMLTHVRRGHLSKNQLSSYSFERKKPDLTCLRLFCLYSQCAQVCIWIGVVYTTVNPYWSRVLWAPKAMSRSSSPSSQSHTAPVKTHLRSPFPSVPWRTFQMQLNTLCRSVDARTEGWSTALQISVNRLKWMKYPSVSMPLLAWHNCWYRQQP